MYRKPKFGGALPTLGARGLVTFNKKQCIWLDSECTALQALCQLRQKGELYEYMIKASSRTTKDGKTIFCVVAYIN